MKIARNNIYLGHNVIILKDTLTLHVRNTIIDLGIMLKDLNSHTLEPLMAGSGLLKS